MQSNKKNSSYEIPKSFYDISASFGNNYINIGCTYTYPDHPTRISWISIIINDANYSVMDLLTIIYKKLRPLNQEGKLLRMRYMKNIFNYFPLN